VEDPAGAFARLAVELHDAAMTSVENTADSLVQFAVQAIGCESAGLALIQRGAPQLAAVSDPGLAPNYQFTFDTGEGPLIAAPTKRSPRFWHGTQPSLWRRRRALRTLVRRSTPGSWSGRRWAF
jgi:hypothetical protein